MTGSDFLALGALFLTRLGATGCSSTKSWPLDSSPCWLESESCLLAPEVLRCLILPVGSAPAGRQSWRTLKLEEGEVKGTEAVGDDDLLSDLRLVAVLAIALVLLKC